MHGKWVQSWSGKKWVHLLIESLGTYEEGIDMFQVGYLAVWGVGDGQGGLVCFDSWGRKESDTTERLNWTGVMIIQDDAWDSFLDWMEGVCFWHVHFYSIFLEIMENSGPRSFLIFPCCTSQSVCLWIMFSQIISRRLDRAWGPVRSKVLPEGSFN